MDLQTAINLAAVCAIAVSGWFGREMWGAVKELRTDLGKLREELPKTYITKDDFREGVHELKALLIAIDNKLDRKQDK